MKGEKKREKIKKIIEDCEKEKNDYLDGWKRAKADLVNYKKEELRRTERMIDREKERMLTKILPVLDNFQRAAKEAEKREEDHLIEGFLKIKEQIERFLKEEGVEKIDAEGKEFDPFYHEAIETVDSESQESGIVSEELQRGYLYKNQVLRPAKVKVVN